MIISMRIRGLLFVAIGTAMMIGCAESGPTDGKSHWHTGTVKSVVTLGTLPSEVDVRCTLPPANTSQDSATPVAIVRIPVGKGHYHKAVILPTGSTVKQGDVVGVETHLCVIRPQTSLDK